MTIKKRYKLLPYQKEARKKFLADEEKRKKKDAGRAAKAANAGDQAGAAQ